MSSQHDELIVGEEVAPKRRSSSRMYALDFFKGVIMVIMALDHVKHDFAAGGGVTSSTSQDPVPFEFFITPADYSGSVWWWLTREVTHLCAPGFAFAMGCGVTFFIASRQPSWTNTQFFKYYGARCLILIGLEQIINWTALYLIPAIAQRMPWSGWIFFSAILTMLGCNLILGSLLALARQWLNSIMRFSGDVLLLIFILGLPVICDFVVPSAIPTPTYVNPVLSFFFVPWIWQAQHCAIVDAILPWLPVVALGIFMASHSLLNPPRLFLAGMVSLVIFVAFRLPYVLAKFHFGSYRPLLDSVTFFSFFGLSKYPPSLTFLTLFVGLDLLLMALFATIPDEWFELPIFRQIVVLGTAPLFFYCLHLFVYSILAAPFAPVYSTSLPGIYLLWVVGIALCYWPTQAYAKFKMSTPKDSVWRFF